MYANKILCFSGLLSKAFNKNISIIKNVCTLYINIKVWSGQMIIRKKNGKKVTCDSGTKVSPHTREELSETSIQTCDFFKKIGLFLKENKY